MRKLLGVALSTLLLLAAAAPASASTPTSQPNAIHTFLTKVTMPHSGTLARSGGDPLAGCQLSGYSNGTLEWTYTVWQDFSYAYGWIVLPVPPSSFTEWSHNFWDYTGPTADPSQTWLVRYSKLATQGTYQFKLIVLGQVLNTSSGYVRVTTNGNGTWSCLAG